MSQKKLSELAKEFTVDIAQLKQSDFQVRQAFISQNETLRAVVSLLGEESVTAEIQRLRQEAQDKQESEMAAGIKMLVGEGVLVPTAEVGATTLNVGTDSAPDGSLRRVQFETRSIPEEVRPQFIGKKPGESVTNNGVTLTITEVYSIDKAAAAAFQQKQNAAANPQPEPLVENPNGTVATDEATQKAIDESGETAPQA
jgi:hypothetical protein